MIPNRQKQRYYVVCMLATMIRFGAYSEEQYKKDFGGLWDGIDKFILQHSKTLNTEENFH